MDRSEKYKEVVKFIDDFRKKHLPIEVTMGLQEIQEEVEIVRGKRYHASKNISNILQERHFFLERLKGFGVEEERLLGYLENFNDLPDGFIGRELLIGLTQQREKAKVKKDLYSAPINLIFHFIEKYKDVLPLELSGIKSLPHKNREEIISIFSEVAADTIYDSYTGFGAHVIRCSTFGNEVYQPEFIFSDVDSSDISNTKSVDYSIIQVYANKMYDDTYIAWEHVKGNKIRHNAQWFKRLVESAYYVAAVDVVEVVTHYIPL